VWSRVWGVSDFEIIWMKARSAILTTAMDLNISAPSRVTFTFLTLVTGINMTKGLKQKKKKKKQELKN